MCQYLTRLWYDPYPLHAWSRSLSFFSALVCDLLPRRLFHGFAKGALPEEYLSHNFDEHYLEDTRLILCLSYPNGGTIDPSALRFLVVREIECGDWLARGYMPAHQYCDLFYTLDRGSAWSAINQVMLQSPGLGQVLGSYVGNRVLTIRLVQ